MINKANYEGMDWVDALTGRKPQRDYEARYASASEESTLDNALEETVEAVFNVPTSEESSQDAIERISKEISATRAVDEAKEEISKIKAKLAATDDRPAIDPVELGVEIKAWTNSGMRQRPITKEEWDNIDDPRTAEEIAKVAVQKMQERISRSWEERAQQEITNSKNAGSRPGRLNSKFDPETDRGGKIASVPSPDDYAPRFGKVPANANSITDPDRLDRFAKEETEHDRSVAESRALRKSREDQIRAEAQEREAGGHRPIHDSGSSKVIQSGSQETEAFVQRVPRNQISMLDNFGEDFEGLSKEEKTARLQSMFMDKWEDNGEKIKSYNEERRASIQRESSKEEEEKSWEKLEKPTSTSDIQERLMNLWMPEAPEK